MRELATIYLRGLAMGVADLIPGVSGGTIALVTGIYDRLIGAFAAMDLNALRLFLRGDWRGAWRAVDGSFLVSLLCGIATSVLSLASVLAHLLETAPHLVWALFMGLILASILHMVRSIAGWRPIHALWLLAGAVVAWWLTHLGAVEVNATPGWVALCGMLAICAWILPGISGSFILLVLGMYEHIIDAVRSLDFPVLLTFALGCGCGLLAFTHVLRWGLRHYHGPIMGVLTGFLVGSLPLLWPWKLVTAYAVSPSGRRHAIEQELLMPRQYAELAGQDPQLIACVLLAVTGFLLVLALELLGSRGKGR
jgi:putative membrane protein